MTLWFVRLLISFLVSLLSKGRLVRSQTTTSVCVQPVLDENGEVVVVADCVCDPTCEICGYYGEAVSGPDDCFTCPEGLVLTELYEDGSGVCSITGSLCIEPSLDANGDIVVATDCVCDPTCAMCGYYGEAVSGPDNCFTCPEGLVLTESYDDGSGTCTTADDSDSTTTTTLCIQPFLDDDGDIIVVTGCVCDPTCEICGYYGETVSGPDDCFTCPEGLVFTELYDDGSGTCTITDNAGTVTEAPTELDFSTIPPGTGTGGSTTSTPGGICMMVYQVADNNLEAFLRVDLSEMTVSSITQSTSTTTWIYHDGLDVGDANFTAGPLLDVYNPDGSTLTLSNNASRYLNWDHDLGKMVVNTTFSSEQHSDNPAVLQAFLEYALTDCVAKRKSEFFLVFSSHGGGFIGFGGDNDNELRHLQRRKLIQSNANIASAIKGALSSVSGAPSQLDVLGFDACLMQSMDAIDDFATIARYYLASEAIEPAHGWAYNELSATNSSIDLAVEVVNTFVSSLQSYSKHKTPKTLAVVNTTAFYVFRDAWDAMCSEMADILSSGNDADFHASLLRARGQTYAFAGYLDYATIQVNSAMDIGDFFVQFFLLCDPDQSSELYRLMTNALDAYNAMFVTAKLGPGTPFGTGMHITWVSKQEYLNYQDIYDEYIFPVAESLPLMGAPNYSRLLALYYNTSTPLDNFGASVCATSSGASSSVSSPSQLIIDPKLFFAKDFTVELRSEVTRSVDFVYVEYGIDVTHLLQDDGLRRRLDESSRRLQARKLEVGDEGTTRRVPSLTHQHQAMQWRYYDTGRTARRLQLDADFDATEDYFFLYGGNLAVKYNGSGVVASWDSTFFWLSDGEDFEPVYAYDDGGGLKSIPVCYFDQNHPVTSAQIAIGVSIEDAVTDLGCEQGFLSFSASADSDGEINLYVYRGNILSEVPLAAGRSIVPISYIEYSVEDVFVTKLLGGISSIVIPWTPDTNATLMIFPDYDTLDVFEADTAFLRIYAYDEDLEVLDNSILIYSYGNNSDGTESPSVNSVTPDATAAPDTNEEPTTGSTETDRADDPPASTETDPPANAETDVREEGLSSNGRRVSLEVGITTLILICSTSLIVVVTK